MAVTRVGRTYELTAVGDQLPGRVRTSKIHFVQTGGASSVSELKNGGSTGVTFVRGIPPSNDTSQVTYGQPQEFDDLYVVALPAGCAVVVFIH